MKSFRAEVSAHGGSWTLLVPSLDNLMRGGNSLIEAEDEMRGAMADLLGISRDEICLELQDRRGIAKERARRTVPSDLGHSAMRT
jgi:hypothetical protein